MTRRRLLALGFMTAPIVGVAVACSFPDVDFAPAAVPDSGNLGDATTSDAEDNDGAPVESAVRDGATIDAAECALRKRCDCDGDGYRAIGCDAGGPDADAGDDGLKEGDCDDLDSFRNPGQTYTDAGPSPDGGGKWDWNCDGIEERAYKKTLNCRAELLANGVLGCVGSGYVEESACGQNVEYDVCTGGPLSCKPSFSGVLIQVCR